MTPQQIATAILNEFATGPDLYPHIDMDGNVSGNVVTLSISTGATITVTLPVTIEGAAHVVVERGVDLVRCADFVDSSQEGLVDTVVGYIARILHQLNHQATV